MSRKQEIYRELLGLSLPLIRNYQTLNFWAKAFNKTCYYESELVHNLYVSILDEGFTDHDIYFLNQQAKWYLDNCSSNVSPNYEKIKDLIEELENLVPESLRNK